MKKPLLLLFFLPLTIFAQTNYSVEDITAAIAHEDQWLLTNIGTMDQMDYSYGVAKMVQEFIKTKTKWEANYSKCGTNCEQWIHQSNAPGNVKKRRISYKLYSELLPNKNRISTKVVFEGNKDLIIDFFMSYWTEDLEFAKGSKGEHEIASARFLTDIATLSIDKDGNASIVVVTGNAKDSYSSTISFN